jgi:NADPH:quinone reductase-like Zn-dependent oxidoreductase
MSANGEQLGQISQLIERRRIRPVIDRVFPFVETDKAVAYTEQGHATGKVIIRGAEIEPGAAQPPV